jgi:glycosyltransferase involved in cell wall biosynthesis
LQKNRWDPVERAEVVGLLDSRIAAPRSCDVRHYVAGGCEHGGGIGRLVGYICNAAGPETRHLVTDTRGPTWNPPSSIAVLARSANTVLTDRARLPARIHQLHVAGRGSTARKLILARTMRTLGCTHILHLHDYDYAQDYLRRPAWQRREIRTMFAGADHVIVLGEGDRITVRDMLGVDTGRVSVLHNSVPDPGEPAFHAGSPPRIVFLGTLGQRKGVPELLQAFRDPRMQRLDWTAVLAGDGPVDDYRKQAADGGLGDRVHIPGWLSRAQTDALLSGSDILVLPSHGEGMAMAVLEGMAHGLAVVATPVGAHREILTGGTNCCFTPVGDPAALARTLADIVKDPELRIRLGRAGRASYLTDLGMAPYMARLQGIYRRLDTGRDRTRAVA